MSTTSADKKSPKVTVPLLEKLVAKQGPPEARRRVTMITAYDATFARLLDQAGADMLLVGDSLGNVVKGEATTLGVTMDEMVYHCRSVARGTTRAQIIGDMPFLSYQVSIEDGIRNAGRLVKEGGAEAVKLEGGAQYAPLVAKLVSIGIPVCGHLGLTPQRVHAMGGFKVQGRGEAARKQLLDDALALEQAGCYAIVLEGIPRSLAAEITRATSAITIGIGAGRDCDGQVLVCYDMLGMNDEWRPKFVKRYDQLGLRIRTAVQSYVDEVATGQFPDDDHSFGDDVRPPDATPYATVVPVRKPTQ